MSVNERAHIRHAAYSWVKREVRQKEREREREISIGESRVQAWMGRGRTSRDRGERGEGFKENIKCYSQTRRQERETLRIVYANGDSCLFFLLDFFPFSSS